MAWSNPNNTGWNTEGNFWSAPTGGSWQQPAYTDILEEFKRTQPNWASMTGQQKSRAFTEWWNDAGWQLIGNAWGGANQAWQDVYNAWLADPDRNASFTYTGNYTMPESPDFSEVSDWQQQQLYGGGQDDPNTPYDESQGIYAIMQQITNQLMTVSEDYRDDWLNQYAEQAGFADAAAREEWLANMRAQLDQYTANQSAMLQNLQTSQVTPEQQKAIRQAMVDQEAQSRRQAEKAYQETGSYASLQRASDEINRAQVADTVKMQMEMALQNFSAAQSAVGQQTDVLMREVEAGNRSFTDYIAAKQMGLNAALQMWQDRAANVLTEAQAKMSALQQQYENEKRLYDDDYARQYAEFERTQAFINAQGELIQAAWAQALGYSTALEASKAYYDAFLQPMIDQWEAEVIPEGEGPDSKGVTNPTGGADDVLGWGSAVLGAGMILLGVLASIFSWGLLTPIAGGLVTGGVGLIGTGMVGVTRD